MSCIVIAIQTFTLNQIFSAQRVVKILRCQELGWRNVASSLSKILPKIPSKKCLFCPRRLQSRSLVSTDPPLFQVPAVTVSHTSVTENISNRLPRPFEVKSLPHPKVASVCHTGCLSSLSSDCQSQFNSANLRHFRGKLKSLEFPKV